MKVLSFATAMVLGLAVLACGGDGSEPPSEGVATGAGLEVELPQDWIYAAGENELVVASVPTDLQGDTPAGPRFRVSRLASVSVDRRLITSIVEEASDVARTISVAEEAAPHEVGAKEGVAIALREETAAATMVRRHVYVHGGSSVVYVFVFESPASAWNASQDVFAQIGQSVVFP